MGEKLVLPLLLLFFFFSFFSFLSRVSLGRTISRNGISRRFTALTILDEQHNHEQ